MKVSHIAILVPKFPNLLQTYVLNHIEGMNKLQIKTTIIASKKGDMHGLPRFVQEFELIANTYYIGASRLSFLKQIFSIPIFNKAYWKTIRKLIKGRIWKQYGLKYFLFTFIRSKVISKDKYQIIHSHSVFSSYNYLFLKDITDIPFITTYHGQVPTGVNRLNDEKLFLIFQKGDIFIVNTIYAKNELIKLGCNEDKIAIIPQGTKLDNFPYKSRSINKRTPIKLLSVGRLSAEKGHHIGIRAVKTLKDLGIDVEYRIVGEGNKRHALNDLIYELNLEKSIFLVGHKSGKHLTTEYNNAEIFLLPSTMETQGVVLQEAQASGLPVIGSNAGGIPDVIINNITGLLFEKDNHIDLVDKITKLINDPVTYKSISDTGREHTETEFNSNLTNRRLLELYNDLISKRL